MIGWHVPPRVRLRRSLRRDECASATSCDDADVVEDRHVRALGVVTAVAVVAVAAAAGGAWWAPPSGVVDRGAAARHAVLGGLIGLALAVTALALVAARVRSWQETPRAVWLGLATVAIAGGALLGSATAPRRPVLDVPDEESPAPARLIDADADGLPDTNAAGDPVVAVDADRDGRFETQAVACGVRSTVPLGNSDVELTVGCDGPGQRSVAVGPGLVDEPRPEYLGDQDRDVGLSRTIVTLVAVVLLLTVLAVLRKARRRTMDDGLDLPRGTWLPPARTSIDPAIFDAALSSSLSALVSDPDPRVGVRAAYAVLLDALAEAGAGRRPHETPDEHLERCLRELEVDPIPLRVLLDLFSLARFSTHVVTETHRREAVTALRSAQEALRVHVMRSAVGGEEVLAPPLP